MNKPEVVPYEEKFRGDFYSINREWLDEFFMMTEGDEDILRHPDKILEEGGEIFFAVEGGQPIGTCAMIRCGRDEFELAKMGVLRSGRRKGFGSLLLVAALDFARRKKALRVTLETSVKLPQAIALYEKFGFAREGEEYIHPLFGRKIFKMIKDL